MDLTDRNFEPPVHGERVVGRAVCVIRSGETLICELDSGQLVKIPLFVLTWNGRSDTRVARELPRRNVA